jgi:hypothetical protein
MSEGKKTWDSGDFDQLMKESHDELADLRLQLQNLMVKFGTVKTSRNKLIS